MSKKYSQCQSCGMPLKMDKKGGGSEKDGSKSSMYCSSCYELGSFTEPTISMVEMQEKIRTILKDEMHWNKLFIWLAVRQLPNLARWK